jgi:hypothetical protein
MLGVNGEETCDTEHFGSLDDALDAARADGWVVIRDQLFCPLCGPGEPAPPLTPFELEAGGQLALITLEDLFGWDSP